MSETLRPDTERDEAEIEQLIGRLLQIGVLSGALLGSRLLPRIESVVVRRLFVAVLVIISLQMLVKGIRG